MIMNRLIYWLGGRAMFRDCSGGPVQERLAHIEDILGNYYDLRILRDFVKAVKDGRCIILPEVKEDTVSLMYDNLKDVFSEWSNNDPSVGIHGMSEDEKKLASAILNGLSQNLLKK